MDTITINYHKENKIICHLDEEKGWSFEIWRFGVLRAQSLAKSKYFKTENEALDHAKRVINIGNNHSISLNQHV